ncbi:M56 family metallopeptidase [Sediminicola sp. 1XM1-17]|uniref:M56 family metallopeptidase n=1 Tax=Sediminicola sp. 1XM1-17 TaxID=3127702 RepID=UPI003077CF04
MWIYLLKFSALLAIFLLFYKVFLEQATMHQFKRFYLLGAFLLAMGIPAITFTEYVLVEPQTFSTDFVQASTLAQNPTLINEPITYFPYILWGLYGLGVVLFSIKFLINLSGVIKRIKNNPKEKSGHCQHVLLQDPIAPHTFFSYVFFNKKKYISHQIPQEVFWHEETHAKQKHSLDILLLELLQIVLWFHPLIYIAKHFIKLNHEFLADEGVLHKGATTSTYQKILLAFSSPDNPEPVLSNSINYLSIKKRIIIMKTHTSQKALWLKSLLLLPLLALLLFSFSNREIVELEQKTTAQQITTPSKIATEIPTEKAEIIEILINKNGQLLVHSQLVELKDLGSFLLKYNMDLSKEERSQTVPSIITIDREAPKKVIQAVEAILTEYGVATINIKGRTYSQQEKGATNTEIKEYNALARKYNSQAKGKYVIKTKDVTRLKQLYDRMTLEQKASAELYPNFPPPPPAVATPKTPKVMKNSDLPAPPPLPADAPEVATPKTPKAAENYKKGNPKPVYDHKGRDGENLAVVVTTDENQIAPPPPPMPPSADLEKLAEQGATFFLNGEPISAEEAIKIAKKNKDININIEGVDSEPPMVKITTKSWKN